MKKFEELERRMIVALYNWSLTPESKVEFNAELASSLIGVGIGMGQQIVHKLHNDEIIARVGNYTPTRYEITLSLIEKAEAILELDPQGSGSVPASDRAVTLDHNSAAYNQTVDALESLHKAVEGNNEYRNADLEDHERRLADIEATIKILENKRVNIGTAKTVAGATLVYLAEKFADQPIGELAAAAWTLLKALLGIG